MMCSLVLPRTLGLYIGRIYLLYFIVDNLYHCPIVFMGYDLWAVFNGIFVCCVADRVGRDDPPIPE